MIKVDGLIKRYGEKTAVNGLTFTVWAGFTVMCAYAVAALAAAASVLRRRDA